MLSFKNGIRRSSIISHGVAKTTKTDNIQDEHFQLLKTTLSNNGSILVAFIEDRNNIEFDERGWSNLGMRG